MAAYATQDDVLARAGRIGGAFSVAGRRPNLTDIDTWLVELSDEVDEAIRGYGYDPAALDANGQKALLDLVAYGTLARAARALNDGSREVATVLTEADAVWSLAMGADGSIRSGDYPVIRALAAGAAGSGAASSAGSLWTDEPDTGTPAQQQAEWNELRGTNLSPAFFKGQHL